MKIFDRVHFRILAAFVLGFAAAIAVTTIVRNQYGLEAWVQFLRENWESWETWKSIVSLGFISYFMVYLLKVKTIPVTLHRIKKEDWDKMQEDLHEWER